MADSKKDTIPSKEKTTSMGDDSDDEAEPTTTMMLETTTMEDESDDEPTIAQDIVVTKFNMAAKIVNRILKEIVTKCQSGQSVGELCDYGDQQLIERANKVFRQKKEMKKGLAFPTCISINNCVCHYSPLRSDTGADVKLADGDVVKVDLGVHIDGLIAVGAHTYVVGASKDNKVTGRKADAVLAAHNALDSAIRMLRPKQQINMEVTDVIQKIAEAFHCKPVENMVSHEWKWNKIDGPKVIIQNPGDKQRQETEKCEFEQYEVYGIDVLISTGKGDVEEDGRTTVYKRNEEVVYQLELDTSRLILAEADKRGNMPFTLRSFEDDKNAKMVVLECERHGLMKPFQVLYEREGEVVAQFKATVLIMSSGLMKTTGLPFEADFYESEHKIEDKKLLQLITSSLKPSKKKPKSSTTKKEEGEKGGEITVEVEVKVTYD